MLNIPAEIIDDNQAVATALVAYLFQAMLSEPIDVTLTVTGHLLETIRAHERARYDSQNAAKGREIAARIDLEGGEDVEGE